MCIVWVSDSPVGPILPCRAHVAMSGHILDSCINLAFPARFLCSGPPLAGVEEGEAGKVGPELSGSNSPMQSAP